MELGNAGGKEIVEEVGKVEAWSLNSAFFLRSIPAYALCMLGEKYQEVIM